MRVFHTTHTRVDVRIAMEQHVVKDTALIPIAETLAARAEQARSLDEVRKKDLRAGDRVLVKTKNSLYTIWVLDEDVYWVSGGWFDLRGMPPQRMGINGCTWGGTAIKQDILAACGLRLEFGNTVLTTRIREIRVIPAEVQTSLN